MNCMHQTENLYFVLENFFPLIYHSWNFFAVGNRTIGSKKAAFDVVVVVVVGVGLTVVGKQVNLRIETDVEN